MNISLSHALVHHFPILGKMEHAILFPHLYGRAIFRAP
jgi:hypothetical protein